MSGSTAEIIRWILIGIAVAFVALDRARRMFYSNSKRNRRFNDPSNNPKPGFSTTCKKHGEAISGIKTNIENIKENIGKIERRLNQKRSP